ncbi:dihydroxyacetone kinase subunit DhaK [Ferrimicrobium sp.]|uniref:dihydroxyacetone kinase subunit DhaK n=1 Tax=Ferrimicrobium sp. TaxID=2926050 RepID=UPI00262A8E2B|nr:dihydroxyacetone kinase subunit DhaK [Ferrimicrobium sp.]
MKKIIDAVETIVDQALDGMVVAYPEYLVRVPDTSVLARKVPKVTGKVGLVSGGGSGHEPAHGGYVGYGMLDAAVAGEVFTSPTPDQVYAGIKAADHGAGVLLVVKNYTGDVMNFDIARELADADAIATEVVLVNDDVAVQDSLYTTGRRGIAGTVLVHKIAGAAAEEGADLATVKAIGEEVVANVASMGFALTSCTVPANGKPTFELGENEIEMGVGIHGEPGIERMPMMGAGELTAFLYSRLVEELGLDAGERVAALVNSMGATPGIELAIMAGHLAKLAEGSQLSLERVLMGEFMTSLEMAGASLTLLRLDDTRARRLGAACDTPALRVVKH